ILEEDINRLFIEFQQLDAGAAKKYQGTGLGLALTKRIVEAQGGYVGVKSVVGVGSTFFAVLPRVIEASTVDVEEPATPPLRLPAPSSPTILVVEDEPGDRAWLGRTLNSAGYEVVFATTGADAIRQGRSRAFDTITLDLLLPDLGGWEVLKELRREGVNKATPVIIVSVVREQRISIGFPIREILIKPVDISGILATIARNLDDDLTGQTILVVDDDLSLLKVMEVSLRKVGYHPICVPSAELGLVAAREHKPSLIVLDLLMPDVDGFKFLQRYRLTDEARRTPVIVWSSRALSQDEKIQLLGSAQAFVLKGSDGKADLLDELGAFVRPLAEHAVIEL
ncbi:MAG TPA: response regulator, partial [Chloroflexota bacterium]|nr:response regulator [Chloroflexota bacterium]